MLSLLVWSFDITMTPNSQMEVKVMQQSQYLHGFWAFYDVFCRLFYFFWLACSFCLALYLTKWVFGTLKAVKFGSTMKSLPLSTLKHLRTLWQGCHGCLLFLHCFLYLLYFCYVPVFLFFYCPVLSCPFCPFFCFSFLVDFLLSCLFSWILLSGFIFSSFFSFSSFFFRFYSLIFLLLLFVCRGTVCCM